MQWMRAYWWYLLRDEPGGNKPLLEDFFGQMQASSKAAAGASCHALTNRCYASVTAAIPAGVLRTRWQNVGMTMGLASDAP